MSNDNSNVEQFPQKSHNQGIYTSLMQVHAVKEVSAYEALKLFDLDSDLNIVVEYLEKFHKIKEQKANKLIAKFKKDQKIIAALGIVPENATQFVYAFMEKNKYEINLRGEFSQKVAPTMKLNGKIINITEEDRKDRDVDNYVRICFGSNIRRDKITEKLRLLNDELKTGFNRNIIDDALSTWADEKSAEVKLEIFANIKYSIASVTEGEKQLAKLLDSFVDGDRELIKKIMMHFIWQVKRKFLGLPVERHMMPVLTGGLHGSGKSTLVKLFTSPLEDGTRSSDFSQITDDRNIELWENTFVMILDEMAYSTRADVEKVKNIITSTTLERRPMGTNQISKIYQSATFIGTSNKTLGELIKDETGNRRFFPVPVKDKFDYDVINSTNYKSIWKMVDEHAECPINSILAEISEIQESERNKSAVEVWLEQFEFVKGKYTGSDFYQEFKLWAEDNWSRHDLQYTTITSFGREIAKHLEKFNIVKKRESMAQVYSQK